MGSYASSSIAVEFKILPGLPGSGPYPEQFTTSGGTHREGLVLQVTPDDGEPWIGNFQPGHGGTSAVVLHPDERTILVLSAGLTYFVDPVTRKLVAAPHVDGIQDVHAQDGFVLLASWTDVTVLGPGEQRWRTPRLAWDGIRNLELKGTRLTAEGWDVLGDVWRPVEVDLQQRVVLASAYEFTVLR